LQERPDLAEIKAVLANTNTNMREELLALEDRILELLSQAKGNVLDDETLITALAQAKVTADVARNSHRNAILLVPICLSHGALQP
jgi:HPt (histidine-containing phosphotransfer) domain-containing protein